MPAIKPPGGAVDWPNNEGAIGVVGFAPWASLQFCQVLLSFVPARKEWEYPRIIADFNSKIPSRGRHLELGETDPSSAIRETILELADAGALVAAVPCNTAHILYERWGENMPIPVPHIGRCTAKWAHVGCPASICALSARNLWRTGMYAGWLAESGIPTRETSQEEASLTFEAIEHVKSGAPGKAGAIMARLGERLEQRGIGGVVLGCTELVLAIAASPAFSLPYIDSNDALAVETLRLANVRSTMPETLWKTIEQRDNCE